MTAMLIPESSALTKWCPFARAVDGGESPASTNRSKDGAPDRDCYCIASACMAWEGVRTDPVVTGYCAAFHRRQED